MAPQLQVVALVVSDLVEVREQEVQLHMLMVVWVVPVLVQILVVVLEMVEVVSDRRLGGYRLVK